MDDGICLDTSLPILAKLKPAFKKDGTTMAGIFQCISGFTSCWFIVFLIDNIAFSVTGNASQVSDGARAVLLMQRSIAMQKGLPILGVFRY